MRCAAEVGWLCSVRLPLTRRGALHELAEAGEMNPYAPANSRCFEFSTVHPAPQSHVGKPAEPFSGGIIHPLGLDMLPEHRVLLSGHFLWLLER